MTNPNLAALIPMFDGYERCAQHRPADYDEQFGTPTEVLQRVLPLLHEPHRHINAPGLAEVGRMLINLENLFPTEAREASRTMQDVRAVVARQKGSYWPALRSFHSYALQLVILVAWTVCPDVGYRAFA
ncbi:hypothetical protein ABT324_28200 [Saccharopolyspora sp. NPDC000359]|uniref:hypothetical protein n=1 Tax=Saccharopolyspora sp. NPDC000359 TaxID=3154251 RepID=UPI003324CAC8